MNNNMVINNIAIQNMIINNITMQYKIKKMKDILNNPNHNVIHNPIVEPVDNSCSRDEKWWDDADNELDVLLLKLNSILNKRIIK